MYNNKNKIVRNRFAVLTFPLHCCSAGKPLRKKSADFKSFVRLLNQRIPGGGFAIKDTAGRIEERLRVKCALISHQFKTASGRKKKDLLAGSYRMNIFLEEVLSVEMLHAELEKETKMIKNLEKENQKYMKNLLRRSNKKKSGKIRC